MFMDSSMVFIKLLTEPEGKREGVVGAVTMPPPTAGHSNLRFPYVELARYNCSQTKENDQLLLFKSTTVPRSVSS